jgi:hypothetical protein
MEDGAAWRPFRPLSPKRPPGLYPPGHAFRRWIQHGLAASGGHTGTHSGGLSQQSDGGVRPIRLLASRNFPLFDRQSAEINLADGMVGQCGEDKAAGRRTRPVLHFSPFARHLALAVGFAGRTDIWVYDFDRENMSRLTSTGRNNRAPIWTPDGKHIVFACTPSEPSICWMRSDGAGETQILIHNQYVPGAFSFSPNGKRLAFWQSRDVQTPEKDIWTVPLDLSDPDHPKPGKPELFLGTSANEVHPAFSPDGNWIDYASNASGVDEPGPGGQWQISSGGGYVPMWSHNGRLFYESNDNRIMVVDYTVKGESLQPGKPRLWSNIQVLGMGIVHNVDLAPDGKRLLVFPRPDTAKDQKGPVQVTFLLNFFDYLRRRAPSEK